MADKSNAALRVLFMVLLILLLEQTSALAGTTGGIEGRIRDQNGNGIIGARVTASSPAQTISVTTGANGYYSILNLSPDTYSVTVSKDGYDTSSTYGITVMADQGALADVELRQAIKTIGHVRTTATASVVSKTVTGDLYAVNTQAISSYNGGMGGAETLYSQNSVVGSLPGVIRAVGTGPGYFVGGSLSLRGGDFTQVGYELDGVPLNRGFDFANSTGFTTNGIASLQLYTGGAPVDEGRAMSGFINEIIARGRYPGGADFNVVVGAPLFNHTLLADVFGSNPDQRFTYFVSTLGTNSYVSFGDRSNLANTSFAVPAGDPGCGQFNAIERGIYGFPALNCTQSYILNQPFSQGAFFSHPYSAGRDTAANLHWAFAHGSLNDDLQALYVVGTTLQAPSDLYGNVGADLSTQAQLLGGGGVFPNAQNQPTWPTGLFYQGQVGQPYNPALLLTLTWPTSQGSVNGVIPPTYQDSLVSEYSIEKLAYTRAITESSFLRLTGYEMYSLVGIDGSLQPFVFSSFYKLRDNMTGVTLNYQNQLDQHNLIKLIGDWDRDLTLRNNYINWLSSGIVKCVAGGVAQAPCTTPGAPVTAVGAPANAWSTVTPLDWDGVIQDSWKPSDKLRFDIGVRWDDFGFQLMPLKIAGMDGIAYLAEELDGQCLHGFAYSPTDPKILGPLGDQNCSQLLPSTGKDAPGAFNWKNAGGSLNYYYTSPRFGATWSVGPRDVIRLSVGRYVQPPNSAYEQYRNNPLWGPGTTAGRLNSFYDALGFNTVHNILPEDSTNYDFSLEHEFSDGYSVKVTPYYRNTRNQVLSIPFNPLSTTFVTGDNFGTARISGFEFLATRNVTGDHGVGGTLAVTDTNSKIRFTQPPGSNSYVNFVNGRSPSGQCLGAGICGYNSAYGTHYAELDPNGYYAPSSILSPTATAPSYVAQWVINLILDARLNGFDIVPTFNYQSGNPYGDPLNFPDPHCAPGAPVSGCTPLPAGATYYQLWGPDPYTGQFDSLGSLKGPSWWTLNVAVSHNIGHNLKASILGTNLIAGVHNRGYPWEQPASQQNIAYGDGFYYDLPQGVGSVTVPNPVTAYYGNNYYPYSSAGILPNREWVFSVSAKV